MVLKDSKANIHIRFMVRKTNSRKPATSEKKHLSETDTADMQQAELTIALD